MVVAILIWMGGMSLFLVILPEHKAKRVQAFIKMCLDRIPISKIVNAFIKKDDE